eukprot:scaffold13528_cov126-Isochrysis_galbana.AAC.6
MIMITFAVLRILTLPHLHLHICIIACMPSRSLGLGGELSQAERRASPKAPTTIKSSKANNQATSKNNVKVPPFRTSRFESTSRIHHRPTIEFPTSTT